MRTFYTTATALLLLLVLVTPSLSLAADFTGGGNTSPDFFGGGNSYSSNYSSQSFQLQNPLKVQSVCGLIKAILQAILVIGLPIAVLFLVFAGLKYVAALGKPEAIKAANQNLLYTVIGIAIFLGAALIAQVIATTVNNIYTQSGGGFQDIRSCN